MKWLRLAAEQGLAETQYGLGYAYYTGEGVTQDYAQAVAWFSLAAEQGNPSAVEFTALLDEKMPSDQIAEGKRLADEYKKKYSK